MNEDVLFASHPAAVAVNGLHECMHKDIQKGKQADNKYINLFLHNWL
jgi:hypothetical protein